MEHFFIGDNFTMWNKLDALFRHTIDTSQVTAIRNRKTQVIDDSVVVIKQKEASECL
jgi:hypothetical protein